MWIFIIGETIPPTRLTSTSLWSGQGLLLVFSTHLDCFRLRTLLSVEANSSDIQYCNQYITSTRIASMLSSKFWDLAIEQRVKCMRSRRRMSTPLREAPPFEFLTALAVYYSFR